MRRVFERFAAALVGAFVVFPIVAAADPDTTFTLGEIEATATGPDKVRAPSSVQQADMDRFDRETVGSAIQMLPGVQLSRVGARNEEAIFVRGFDLRQTPVFIDGIPVYVPYDGNVDLARFTTFDVSKIQVSKGWASVLTGPNTLGGAINLVSQRPIEGIHGWTIPVARFDRGAQFNGYETAGSLGIGQDQWWAQASGSWVDFDHYTLPSSFDSSKTENGGIRENSYHGDWKLNAKLAYAPTPEDEYSLNYINQHGEKGMPPYAGTDPAVSPRYWQWPYWNKQSAYWLSRTSFGEDRYLKTRAYYDSFQNELSAFDDAGYQKQRKASSFDSFYDDYTYGGSVEGGGSISPGHLVKASVQYKRDVHREHDRGEPEQQMSDDIWSTALEYTWHVFEPFDLVSGVAYDWYHNSEAEEYNSRTRLMSDFSASNSSALRLQMAGVLRLGDSSEAHVSVSRNGRFPTLKDRYSYRLGSAIPNPGLSPEYTINYEIGASGTVFGNTRLDAALFYSDITDLIQSVNLTRNTFQLQNIGKATYTGFELGARSFVVPWLEIGGAYTLLKRHNRTNTNVKLTGTPDNSLFFYVSCEALQGLHLIPSVQYDTSRHLTTLGDRGGEVVLLDFAVRYEIVENVVLEAGAHNLLDQVYELDYGFPEEGRNYYTKATLRF